MLQSRVNRLVLLPILAAVAFMSPSCTVRSQNPLSDPDEAHVDERLFGVWRHETEGKTIYLFVGKPKRDDFPKGIMAVSVVDFDKDRRLGEPGQLVFFVTTLENGTYVSLMDDDVIHPDKFPKWDKTKIKHYSIAKYTVTGDTLTILPMDVKAAEASVGKGQVKGTIQKGDFVNSVEFTDSTANITKLIQADAANALFPAESKMVFKHIK